MTEPRWLNQSEQQMWRAFGSMRRSLDRALENDLIDRAGLSTADFTILVPLSEAPDRRLRARDLGQLVDWDRSRLSHQIRRMEQRRLVTRRDCPSDARGTFVELTQHGWQTIQEAAPAHVEATRVNFFDVLTEADVSTLHDISCRVSDRIASLRGAPGNCASPGAGPAADHCP